MQSVWVKWKMSALEYWELTVNDVVGEVCRAIGGPPCEARGELHSSDKYAVYTKRGLYVLCRLCCKTLGLPLPPRHRYKTSPHSR